MLEWICNRLSDLLFMFPESPFQKITLELDNVNLLNYVNWVIPFDLVTDITSLWLGGVLAWKIWGLLYTKLRAVS